MNETRDCAVPGCEVATSRKPYCLDHVDRLPLPAALIAERLARARELRAAVAGKWREIDPQSSRSLEILAALERCGDLKLTTLFHELSLEVEGTGKRLRALESYAKALAGTVEVVDVWSLKRGQSSRVARLVEAARAQAS